MKKMTLVTIVGILTTAVSAFAENNPLTSTEAANPNATPYQKLQKFYDQSPSPAALSDFDLITDSSSNQNCAIANKDSISPDNIYFVRAEFIKPATPAIPGTPSKGPLFPGTQKIPATPDQKSNIVLFTSDRSTLSGLRNVKMVTIFNPESGDVQLEDAQSALTSTPTDFIQALTSPNNPGTSLIMSARKNGSLIAIHLVFNSPDVSDELYAYCYRQWDEIDIK